MSNASKSLMWTLGLVLVFAVAGCDVGGQWSSLGDGLSGSSDGWFRDSRPIDTGFEVVQDTGVSKRAEASEAVLFVDCRLDYVVIDWPRALILSSNETIRTIEAFARESGSSDTSISNWFGSLFSRSRVYRGPVSIINILQAESSINTSEFIKRIGRNDSLEISQGDNDATWSLAGFRDALDKHCT